MKIHLEPLTNLKKPCNFCGKEECTSFELCMLSRNLNVNNIKSEINNQNILDCMYCQKSFNRNDKLRAHMKLAHKGKN